MGIAGKGAVVALLLIPFISGLEQAIFLESKGRFAEEGTMFNEHTEQFLDFTIFNKAIPDNLVCKIPAFSVVSKVRETKTLQQKADMFGFDAKTSLTGWLNLFKMTGSAQYLTENFDYSKNTEITFYTEFTFNKSYINLFYDNLLDYVSEEALEMGTHYVQSKITGASTAVNFRHHDSNAFNVRHIEGAVSAAMSGWGLDGGLEGGGEGTSNSTVSFEEIDIYVFSTLEGAPTKLRSLEIAKGFIGQIPEMGKNASANNRLSATSYLLFPTSSLKKRMRARKAGAKLISEVSTDNAHVTRYSDPLLNNASLPVAVLALSNLENLNRIHHNAQMTMSENRNCIPDISFRTMQQLSREFTISMTGFKQELTKLLKNLPMQDIKMTLEIIQNKTEEYEDRLKIEDIMERIRRIEVFKNFNLTYIGRDANFFNYIQLTGVPFYAFMLPEDTRESKLYLYEITQFTNLLPNSTHQKVVVDCAFNHYRCDGITTPVVTEWRNNQLVRNIHDRKEETLITIPKANLVQTIELYSGLYVGIRDGLDNLTQRFYKLEQAAQVDRCTRIPTTDVYMEHAGGPTTLSFTPVAADDCCQTLTRPLSFSDLHLAVSGSECVILYREIACKGEGIKSHKGQDRSTIHLSMGRPSWSINYSFPNRTFVKSISIIC